MKHDGVSYPAGTLASEARIPDPWQRDRSDRTCAKGNHHTMTTPDHTHPNRYTSPVDLTAYGLPSTVPELTGQLIAACTDSCTPCQAALTEQIADEETGLETVHLMGALYVALMGVSGDAYGTAVIGNIRNPDLVSALILMGKDKPGELVTTFLPSLTRAQRVSMVKDTCTYLTGMFAIRRAERIFINPN